MKRLVILGLLGALILAGCSSPPTAPQGQSTPSPTMTATSATGQVESIEDAFALLGCMKADAFGKPKITDVLFDQKPSLIRQAQCTPDGARGEVDFWEYTSADEAESAARTGQIELWDDGTLFLAGPVAIRTFGITDQLLITFGERVKK